MLLLLNIVSTSNVICISRDSTNNSDRSFFLSFFLPYFYRHVERAKFGVGRDV